MSDMRRRSLKHLPVTLILASRWLMAPLYFGLVVSFLLILVRFFTKLCKLFWTAPTQSTNEVIVGVLSLVELSLMGNLLIMVIFSGYENYVSRLYAEDDPERPAWMEHVDFSDIKLKLMGSIVAITAIQLLELFLDVTEHTDRELYFAIGIHAVFVLSCVLLALMDWLSARAQKIEQG